MIRFLLRFKYLLPGLLSGILVGTSYIPFPPWALFFSYVPILIYIIKYNPTVKHVLITSWFAQFILSLIGFHWIYFVSREFGFMPPWLAFITLLLFSSFIHWHIPLAFGLLQWIRKKWNLTDFSSLLGGMLLFWLIEKYWPMIFQWHLGYNLLFSKIPAYQLADLIGFEGLNLLILLSQGIIVLAIINKNLRIYFIGGVVLFWLFLSGIGTWKQHQILSRSFSTFKVAIIQANIGNLEKIQSKNQIFFNPKQIIDHYFNLTQEVLQRDPHVDLIVWPEAAIPEFLDDFNKERKYAKYFFSNLKNLGKPLITGAFSTDPMDRLPRRDFNALFSFNSLGEHSSPPYRKTKLLIFGEYTPLGDLFPFLKKYNPAGSGFSQGDGPQVIFLDHLKIGTQICYESLDPQFSSQLSKLGAQLIVNITNDSWFGPISEPQQHLYMTLSRAIETRLSLIRSTNTGISSAIDASGFIYTLSPINQKWGEIIEIKLFSTEPTFYTRYGFTFPWIILIILISLLYLGKKPIN